LDRNGGSTGTEGIKVSDLFFGFTVLDITAALSNDLPTYPKDPDIVISQVRRLKDGDSCNLSQISMGLHSGTHVDAPLHFIEAGETIDNMALDKLCGTARVIDATREKITVATIEEHSPLRDMFVLLKTRDGPNAGALEEANDGLDRDCIEFLVDQDIKAVGIDRLSVERKDSLQPRTHVLLLERGIVVLEGLELSAVPEGDYYLIAAPLKIKDAEAAPARVFLLAMTEGGG
jgi:arylformamidase